MFNMEKKSFIGLRIDTDTAKFVKEESQKAKKTMSEWIRDGIKIKRDSK